MFSSDEQLKAYERRTRWVKTEMSHPGNTNGKGENDCRTTKKIKRWRVDWTTTLGGLLASGGDAVVAGNRARRKSTWMMRGNGRQKRFPYCPPIAREFRAPLLGGPAAADRQRSPESRSFVFRARENLRHQSDPAVRLLVFHGWPKKSKTNTEAGILRANHRRRDVLTKVFCKFRQTQII